MQIEGVRVARHQVLALVVAGAAGDDPLTRVAERGQGQPQAVRLRGAD